MLFVEDVEGVAAFYERKLGLKVLTREPGFVDFDAGDARLSLHSGQASACRNKFCFYVEDVSGARRELVARGVKMGRDPGAGPGLKLCDGKDPAGNIFQLSNRK